MSGKAELKYNYRKHQKDLKVFLDLEDLKTAQKGLQAKTQIPGFCGLGGVVELLFSLRYTSFLVG